MPSAEVTRSDSNRSDTSLKPRVSFNRDVHIKRIVPRERVSGAVTGIDGGETVLTSPVRKERRKKSKKEIEEEAAKVISQADNVGCIANDKGAGPEKYYSLPNRKRTNIKELNSSTFNSLDRKSTKRQGSLEFNPPKKPPRTFSSETRSRTNTPKPSIFDIFKKPENPVVLPKKSNLRRSVSDAAAFKSKNPTKTNPNVRKRSDSEREEPIERTNDIKKLSPIIEVTQREDYFVADNKDDVTVPETLIPQPVNRPQSVTEQLKDYIAEVDEELYKETGIRISTLPPIRDPIPIIIDVDKAENISINKKHKLNFGLGKKIKSLTQKKPKTKGKNDGNYKPVYQNEKSFKRVKVVKDIVKEVNDTKQSEPVKKPKLKDTEKLEEFTEMIHSSQKPVEKPPLTKGKTVNSMVKRLSNDSCSPPPQTKLNVLIMPNVSVQHNNNQPFSYTRGISPEKYTSNEDLPCEMATFNKPVVYAQVVKDAGKETIHTTYNNRRQTQSDSDEGLGGEDSFGFNRKYDTDKAFTRLGNEGSYLSDTDKLLDEIDKYKAESPILPKYRNPSHLANNVLFSGIMERGRGDGMDAKRRESLTEIDNFGQFKNFSSYQHHRNDLAARRDLLESRMNRRITEKTTPSPEYYPGKTVKNNVFISEKSSKYYRSGAASPLDCKEKFVIESKKDDFGERHFESRTKRYYGTPNDPISNKYELDNEPKSLSDYRSSPENNQFESSHHTTTHNGYRTEKPKQLIKDKHIYKSTPEMYYDNHFRSAHSSYHESLPRGNKIESKNSQKFRSERFLNRNESDRRTDRLADSGIENDLRRDSSENYPVARPRRGDSDLYNESEDEGFASSLLIANEKNHTDTNLHISRRDYDDSDVNSRGDQFYRKTKSKYVSRERSIDDGSHFDPRIDKDVVRVIEKKPPKPEKKSGLEKVKSLFTRDKKKDKISTFQKGKSKSLLCRKSSPDDHKNIKQEDTDFENRRRLSTPSPTRDIPKKIESTHSSWLKSLDRLTKRRSGKHYKNESITTTEDAANFPKLSSSVSNLRFFGDTDQESNSDSTRENTLTKKRSGIRSYSIKDLHNISEEKKRNYNVGRKVDHHRSITNVATTGFDRDIKGSRTSLKPPISPTLRYPNNHTSKRDERRRPRRQDISSVESSTEGDSSQQSQRSVVYLHAATIGDIPGPEYLRTSTRTASREDLTSTGSSLIQPHVKTVSRSFSVLAPWKPRHHRERMDIDYTQYNKSPKSGKYEQRSSRTASRNDNSTLRRKAAQQESKRNGYQSINRRSRSKENISHSKEDLLRGSTSTLYKKKDKLPRENSRYIRDRDDRKMSTKSQSVESISKKSRDDGYNVNRSASMPRDTEKTAGWFKRTKKSTSTQRL
ncbi:uncharacterized protein LOC126744646 isoform X2 [Anthonomus grandis grandis]|uniref:uncharacterized protein LOC126744646 isoform X2 n=1 Tax=Anthonomus grandis grandis TaxID=2921223 RepID=UPI0021658118|nr:uncharacterized protein LOC126744646 isoform X2 [Anthonomus grandis grandis]